MKVKYHDEKLFTTKFSFVVIFLLFLTTSLFATHNRAGEITYKQISALTYEVTVLTYTSTGPGWTADRPEIEISWGDNTFSVLQRCEEVFLPDYYKRNKYVGRHTYGGPGVFNITVEDPNRNANVANIPNSVNTLFAISTTMIVDPTLGLNNTPILTQPPVDKAAIGQTFIHNPGAYDPDGDSLSYKLTTCREENGQPIANYTLPPASDYIKVDEITGDLIWHTPVLVGVYNVAMLIEEWRGGIKIGEIIRDMQIEVFNSGNAKPDLDLSQVDSLYGDMENICVEAGTFMQFTVKATDKNNDSLKLTAYGAPFVASDDAPAHFEQTLSQAGYAEGKFEWRTNCSIVRKEDYILNFKAQDNSEIVNLVDIKSLHIKVVGPAVQNFQAVANLQQIDLSWSSSICANVVGYNIYRKISATGFVHDFCQIGVPGELGYEKIAFVEGHENTTFTDNDVAQGHEYCYLICAVFPDNVEGYASEEVCAKLDLGLPVITNVSVENTSRSEGKIYVAWQKPELEDAELQNNEFQYVIYRSQGFLGENFTEIATLNSIDSTHFYDENINTMDYAYTYKIEFYSGRQRSLVGTPSFASSVFVDLSSTEAGMRVRWRNKVPWLNYDYEIYRHDTLTSDFVLIGNTTDKEFVDEQVNSGGTTCYKVKSLGKYTLEGFPQPLINASQEVCREFLDTTPPFVPQLTVVSVCDSLYNHIYWSIPDSCKNDIAAVNLYYTSRLDGEYQQIYRCEATQNCYNHLPENGLSGCYYINVEDKEGNVSANTPAICVDDCSYYDLPNVFTPNGDGVNDYFHPIGEYRFVEKVQMTILNRWGQTMFETNDPNIMWDGRNKMTGQLVVPGVYFYVCDVYEERLTGLEVRHLKGFIHVFTPEKFIQNNE